MRQIIYTQYDLTHASGHWTRRFTLDPIKGVVPYPQQGAAGLRSAPVGAKRTSTGRSAPLCIPRTKDCALCTPALMKLLCSINSTSSITRFPGRFHLQVFRKGKANEQIAFQNKSVHRLLISYETPRDSFFYVIV